MAALTAVEMVPGRAHNSYYHMVKCTGIQMIYVLFQMTPLTERES